MRFLKTFSTCLVALALHGTAWAEIYETTDAQGNPDFTDSPPDAGAEVINLPETNVIDAPPPEQQATITTADRGIWHRHLYRKQYGHHQ